MEERERRAGGKEKNRLIYHVFEYVRVFERISLFSIQGVGK